MWYDKQNKISCHKKESVMRNIFMRYPEGRGKTVTFSYDDGTLHCVRSGETITI